MSRPTCVLCGIEFPKPVTPGELEAVLNGSGEPYFYVSILQLLDVHARFGVGIDEMYDHNRALTIQHTEGRTVHWERASAEKHARALRKALSLIKLHEKNVNLADINRRAVENAA